MIGFPVKGTAGIDFRITQHFDTPVTYTKSGIHGGIDIAPKKPGTKGVVLYAPHEGYVQVKKGKMLGNYIIIRSEPYKVDGESRESLLAHCETISAVNEQYVAQGDPVAIMGTTGHSTGIHCHWEYRVFKNGKWILIDVEPYSFFWFTK